MEEKLDVKNLGMTPADLLIIEIKKPNRPVIPKNNSIFGKNNRKMKKNFIYKNISNITNYKDPKVRQ